MNLSKTLVKVSGWLKKSIHDKEVLLTFWHFIGKLTGHFYDKNGNPTTAMNKFERLLEQAKKKPKYRDEDLKRFPRCITHYEVGFGRKMMCSKNRQEIV